MIPSREELALTVDEAEWRWLRAHLERNGIIIVAPGLDLVEAGLKIAADDAASVQVLIEGGQLTRPTREDLAAWDGEQGKRFLTLIVSPYVLIQEKRCETKEVTP